MASEEADDVTNNGWNDGEGSTNVNDDTELSKPFEVRELDIIRVALQKLQEQSRAQKGSADGETEEPKIDDEIQDVDGIERLLKKVQAAQARQTPLSQGKSSSEEYCKASNGKEETKSVDISQAVQEASRAAIRAANAAQRSSQAIEELQKTLHSSTSLQLPENEIDNAIENDGDEGANESSDKEQQQAEVAATKPRETDISKRIARQNTVTHVVLGFIIVSSFIWRWVCVKFVREVSDSFQNPFQGATDMFDNFKADYMGSDDDDDDDNDFHLPYMKFPNFLKPEEYDKAKRKTKAERAKRREKERKKKEASK